VQTIKVFLLIDSTKSPSERPI